MNDQKMPQLIDDERGTGLFEYALLVSLIAVVSIAAVTFVGTRTRGTFVSVSKELAGLTTIVSISCYQSQY